MARRLVERGVRFVQIYSGGEENEKSWDGHLNIEQNHRGFAAETDIPIAGLLTDLKQRGLLVRALVWGGSSDTAACPTPARNSGQAGRITTPTFTTWFAGGGVKAERITARPTKSAHKAPSTKSPSTISHASTPSGDDHESSPTTATMARFSVDRWHRGGWWEHYH
jgi:hypothetical protein